MSGVHRRDLRRRIKDDGVRPAMLAPRAELPTIRSHRSRTSLPAGLPNLTVLTTEGRKVLDLNTAIRHKCPTS